MIEAIQQAVSSDAGRVVIMPMAGRWSIVRINLLFAEVQGGFKSRTAAQKYADKHDITIEDRPTNDDTSLAFGAAALEHHLSGGSHE